MAAHLSTLTEIYLDISVLSKALNYAMKQPLLFIFCATYFNQNILKSLK